MRLRKAFANDPWANIKFSKTQLHKIGQSGDSSGSLTKSWLAFNENAIKPLAKSV